MATGIPEKVGEYMLGKKPKKLGQGSFGIVFLGCHEETEDRVAIKRITNITWDITKRELSTIEKVQGHPNILTLLQTIEDEENFVCWIVTEFCDLGNLSEYATSYHLDNRHKLNIMVQCTKGLAHLHGSDKRVVHRDMKPDNVLLKTENGNHVAKIADFGVSKVIETIADLKTFTGTLPYMAPEMLIDRKDPKYSNLVDVFASGLVFLQLLLAVAGKGLGEIGTTNTALGSQMNMLKTDIPMTVVKIELEDTGLVLRIKQILTKMICENPEERLTMDEVAEQFDKLRKSLRTSPSIPARYSATDASGGVPLDSRLEDLDEEDAKTTLYGCGDDAKFVRSGRVPAREIANRVPEIKASPPIFHRKSTFPLPFQSDARIAYSNETLIMENPKSNSLVCYSTTGSVDQPFKKAWEKQLPVNVKFQSRKYLMGDKLCIKYRDEDPTYIFSSKLEPIKNFFGSYGRLRGTLQSNKLVYSKLAGRNYLIHIYQVRSDEHKVVMTLDSTYSSYRVSVCEHKSTGYIAVVDDGEDTLEIFDSAGHLKHRIKFNFSPQLSHAVAATEHWIVVASCYWRDDLHIFNWQGQEVGVIRRSEGWFWEGGVHGIVCDQEDRLVIPTGPWGRDGVDALHVFSAD